MSLAEPRVMSPLAVNLFKSCNILAIPYSHVIFLSTIMFMSTFFFCILHLL